MSSPTSSKIVRPSCASPRLRARLRSPISSPPRPRTDATTVSLRAISTRRRGGARRAHAVDNERREPVDDAAERRVRLAPIPFHSRIAHANQRQGCQSWIEIAPQFARCDTGFDHALQNAFVLVRDPADAARAVARQKPALAQETAHVITARFDRRQMAFDDRRQLVGGGARTGRNRLRPLDKIADAAQTDLFQRRFLRRYVIIKAGLAHSEAVGDILGRSAVIAALREHRGGGIDNLLGAAARPFPARAADGRHDRSPYSTTGVR